jgi:hypothetical protein
MLCPMWSSMLTVCIDRRGENDWATVSARSGDGSPRLRMSSGHRTRARWYTTKTEPSYDDMAVKLRRVIIAARFRGSCPEQVTPQETRAVLAAWAAAGLDQQKLRNTRGDWVTVSARRNRSGEVMVCAV